MGKKIRLLFTNFHYFRYILVNIIIDAIGSSEISVKIGWGENLDVIISGPFCLLLLSFWNLLRCNSILMSSSKTLSEYKIFTNRGTFKNGKRSFDLFWLIFDVFSNLWSLLNHFWGFGQFLAFRLALVLPIFKYCDILGVKTDLRRFLVVI